VLDPRSRNTPSSADGELVPPARFAFSSAHFAFASSIRFRFAMQASLALVQRLLISWGIKKKTETATAPDTAAVNTLVFGVINNPREHLLGHKHPREFACFTAALPTSRFIFEWPTHSPLSPLPPVTVFRCRFPGPAPLRWNSSDTLPPHSSRYPPIRSSTVPRFAVNDSTGQRSHRYLPPVDFQTPRLKLLGARTHACNKY